MRDRWIGWCRRRVPPSLRERAFDPAIDDLLADRAHAGARGLSPAFLLRVLVITLQCRRLREIAPPADDHPRRLAAWWYDTRHAVRGLVRAPLFSATAILTLAIGIGANLTIFGFVNTFLLASAPVPNPAGLVRVFGTSPRTATDTVSFPNYRDLRDGAAEAIDLAAHAQTPALVGVADAAGLRTVELVSGNYFRVLGLQPLAGRWLDDRDNRTEGGHPVVVISESWWRSRHGGARVIGERLEINNHSFEIVGVAPEGFRGTYASHRVDVWAPLAMQQQVRPRGQSLEARGWGWLSMIGRLHPGVTETAATLRLTAAAAGIVREHPRSVQEGFTAAMQPAHAVTAGERDVIAPYLAIVFAFTVLLLIVTCANVAGLVQARHLARRRDVAIRQSLGASGARLAVAGLTESVILAGAGGLAGLALSRLAAAVMSRLPLPTAMLGDVSIATTFDGRLAGYAVLVSCLTALVFGALPAVRRGRSAPVEYLKSESPASGGSRQTLRLRRAAVFVQVVVSAVLLVAAGLLAASLARVQQLDPGFPTGNLALLSINLRQQGVPSGAWRDATTRILERVRAEAGVAAAATGRVVPLSPGSDRMGFRVPGFSDADGRSVFPIDFNVVDRHYFATLGLQFVAGMPWPPLASGEAPAVVINDTMARRFWTGGSAVGQTIEVVGRGPARIAGVVRDSAYYAIGESPRPYVYLPAEIAPPAEFVIFVRTHGAPDAALEPLSRSLRALDRRFAPTATTTFDDFRRVPLFPARMLLGAAVAFGLMAIALVAVGLYGVASSSVAQRRREIGLRIALGATRERVLASVLGEALRLAALGIAGGLAAGYGVGTLLQALMRDVRVFELPVYAGVVALVAAAAVLGAWIPARRAATIDPIQALK